MVCFLLGKEKKAVGEGGGVKIEKLGNNPVHWKRLLRDALSAVLVSKPFVVVFKWSSLCEAVTVRRYTHGTRNTVSRGTSLGESGYGGDTTSC